MYAFIFSVEQRMAASFISYFHYVENGCNKKVTQAVILAKISFLCSTEKESHTGLEWHTDE